MGFWIISNALLCFCRYLQELGYTDSLLDVRSSRVRSILSLSAVEPAEPALVNGTAEQGRHGKCAPAGEAVPTGNTDLSLQVKQAKSEAEQNRLVSHLLIRNIFCPYSPVLHMKLTFMSCS